MPTYFSIVLLSAAAAAVAASTLTQAQQFKVGGIVKTTSGDLNGKPSAWKAEVSEYLGIPFAQPPTGSLRWAPPVALKAEGKAVDALKFGYSCASSNGRPNPASANITQSGASSAMGGATDEQREDCLYLNVWTKPQTGEKKKAVMVWIYGGAFIVGSGSNKAYDGALLADEYDVVVVNFNYRLGVYGFPGMPFLQDKNPGLLDQRLALEWVRDNIEKFGGDPARITIFGQSAGAASVDYYSFAWTKDPIVNGLIPQSGTVSLMTATGNSNVNTWYAASQKLGCGGQDAGEKTLACLRSKTTIEISDNMKSSSGGTGGLKFGAFTPRPDGRTVFDDYAARSAAGNFIKKPVLIGNTENEMVTFLSGTTGGAGALGGLLSNPRVSASLNNVFSCPAGTTAKARAAFVPTWRYSFAGDYPNQVLASGAKGPWHGSEIGLVFGTTSRTRSIPDSSEQAALGKKIRDAWTKFAKNPESGLNGVWPKHEPEKPSVVILGGKDTGEITYKTSAQYDATCSLTGKMGSLFGKLGAPKGQQPRIYKA